MHLAILTGFLVWVSFAGSALATSVNPSQSLTLNYQIFVGGFETGRVELSVIRDKSKYVMTSEVRSLGLIDAVIGFRSGAKSTGHVRHDVIWPGFHSADNLWMGDKRYVRINYDTRGPKQVEVEPPPEDDDRKPVPPELLIGTMDALSASLALSRMADQTNGSRCTGTVPVFDGRRRYDIVSRGVGADTLKGRVFNGAAYKCEVDLVRIAGHSESPWLPQQENEGGDIWYAALSKDWPRIPVRFETDIGMGSVVIHLTYASGAGLTLGRAPAGD